MLGGLSVSLASAIILLIYLTRLMLTIVLVVVVSVIVIFVYLVPVEILTKRIDVCDAMRSRGPPYDRSQIAYLVMYPFRLRGYGLISFDDYSK